MPESPSIDNLNPVLRARDLPTGLLAQLGGIEEEAAIVAVFRMYPVPLDISQLLVGLYDHDGKERERGAVTRALGRMESGDRAVLKRVTRGRFALRENGSVKEPPASSEAPDGPNNPVGEALSAMLEDAGAKIVTVESEGSADVAEAETVQSTPFGGGVLSEAIVGPGKKRRSSTVRAADPYACFVPTNPYTKAVADLEEEHVV